MKIKFLTTKARTPERATLGASCWDVYAAYDAEIEPRGRALVRLGFAVEVNYGTELQIRPRSGVALRQGVVAHLGTIDSDYRGEVGVILFNHSDAAVEIKQGERVAQMALCPVFMSNLITVDELSETARGAGGFGSTGRF